MGFKFFFLKKYCNSFKRNPHVMYYDILGNLGRWHGTIYYVMLALIQYYTNEFYKNLLFFGYAPACIQFTKNKLIFKNLLKSCQFPNNLNKSNRLKKGLLTMLIFIPRIFCIYFSIDFKLLSQFKHRVASYRASFYFSILLF